MEIVPSHPTGPAALIDLVVVAVALAGPAWSLFSAIRWWRRARVAAAVKTASSLERVGDVVVSGRAEPEGLPEPMVVVTIRQVGRQWRHKGHWRHKWTETDRDVVAKPFWLFAENGDVVRVEPGDDPHIADDLDDTVPVDRTHRIRKARLDPGEDVIVAGRLVRREGDPPWALVRRDGERMLLSTRPLDADARRRALSWLGAAGILSIGVIVAVFAVGQNVVLALNGQVVDARYDRVETWTSSDKNGTHHHAAVVAQAPLPSGQTAEVRVDVSTSVGAAVEADPPETVRFLIDPDRPWIYQFGDTPTNTPFAPLFEGLMVSMGTILSYGVVRAAVPWYDRRAVVEQGRGRLEDV